VQTDVDDHRINVKELAGWLKQQAGEETNYVAVNLSGKSRSTVDYTPLANSVVEFAPYSRHDVVDETPAIGEVFRVIYALKFLLHTEPATLLALHCNSGIQRVGFVLACFLAYEGAHPSVHAALDAFGEARLGAGGGAALRDSFLPSWRYLLGHVDALLRAPAASLPSAHTLSYIVLSLPILAAKARAAASTRHPVVQLYEGRKVVFDSTSHCQADEDVRWEGDKLIVELRGAGSLAGTGGGGGGEGADAGAPDSGGLTVCGDYQLWLLLPDTDGPAGGFGGAPRSPTRRGPGLHDLGSRSAATLDAAFDDDGGGGGGGGQAAASGARGGRADAGARDQPRPIKCVRRIAACARPRRRRDLTRPFPFLSPRQPARTAARAASSRASASTRACWRTACARWGRARWTCFERRSWTRRSRSPSSSRRSRRTRSRRPTWTGSPAARSSTCAACARCSTAPRCSTCTTACSRCRPRPARS
jgi:hypothetical protein